MASTQETRFLLTAKNKTKAAFNSVRGDLKSLSTGTVQLTGAIAALAGGAGFALLGNGLVDTNIQFQTMKSSLKTLTGSAEEANKTFDSIVKFATTTPFALEQVTGAFIKMKAMGLDPSEEALTAYGNTASAMGKSLDQMIEAVLDAASGEFERLKEFGIKAKKQGENVTFTFQGISTTIKNESAAINRYLENIGNTNFSGAMKDQMNNMGPAFDNFATAIDLLQVRIGESGLNDAVAAITNDFTRFIEQADGSKISDATLGSLQALADVLAAISATTEGIGKAVSFLGLTGTEDEYLRRGITGGSADYRLGDFNRANLSQADNFENFKRDIESGTFGRGSTDELTKQTGLLERMTDSLDNAVQARAG